MDGSARSGVALSRASGSMRLTVALLLLSARELSASRPGLTHALRPELAPGGPEEGAAPGGPPATQREGRNSTEFLEVALVGVDRGPAWSSAARKRATTAEALAAAVAVPWLPMGMARAAAALVEAHEAIRGRDNGTDGDGEKAKPETKEVCKGWKREMAEKVPKDMAQALQSYGLACGVPGLPTAQKIVNAVGGVLTNFALLAVFAYIYKSKVADHRPAFPDPVQDAHSMAAHGDFHHGLCDCFGSLQVCCYAACCPAMRVADTLAATGLMAFWKAFLAYAGIEVAFELVGLIVSSPWLYWCHGLLLVLIFVPNRKNLRRKFGSQTPEDHLLWDVAKWFCCTSCSLAQEGMEVDRAQSFEVRCCCKYEHKEAALVGPPTSNLPGNAHTATLQG